MKILIADDNHERVAKVVDYLVKRCGIDRDAIDTESTGYAVRQRLLERQYALLLLDVMLPFRIEQEPSHDTSVAILTELTETDRLRKPGYVIGLTAYEEAERTVAPDFRDRAWVLVRSDDAEDSWLETIGSSVRYIAQQTEQRPTLGFTTDVLVLAALRLEMDAFHDAGWQWDPEEPFDDSCFVTKGHFNDGVGSRLVVSAVASRMGMVPMASLATKLIQHYRPRLVVVPGISAGVRGRTELGDVICADTSWDYQSGKHVGAAANLQGFLIDPHFIPVDQTIASRWDRFARDDQFAWQVWKDWPGDKPSAPPKLLKGPVATGSAVLADKSVTERILLQQRKLLGVEMELYGAYVASEYAAKPRPMVVGLKSVCDFADADKADGSQKYSAYVSARVAQRFVEQHMQDFSV